MSKYNFPNEIWYCIPDQEWIAKVVSFVPVILFGLIGNALLITIILRNKKLRTPTNLLIANMATADFATLLICPIMVMYRDFFQNYLLGPVGCKSEGFMQASLLITAVLSLCAVSYDRLTAIVLPQETRLTMKGAKLVILATWLLGAGFSVPLIIFRNYRVGALCRIINCLSGDCIALNYNVYQKITNAQKLPRTLTTSQSQSLVINRNASGRTSSSPTAARTSTCFPCTGTSSSRPLSGSHWA